VTSRSAAALGLLLATTGARAATPADCFEALDALHVAFEIPAHPPAGVESPVQVAGPLGGVVYRAQGGGGRALILDCSLVYSLAVAGRFLADAGVTTAWFGDAYHQRYVKGTTRISKHSYGLALDVHRFTDAAGAVLSVAADYETGLGRGRDCLGRPSGDKGRNLRLVWCQLARSELFKLVLDPDYDEDHRDHFHLQALPWGERDDLAWR
jgi:hypothetical protein